MFGTIVVRSCSYSFSLIFSSSILLCVVIPREKKERTNQKFDKKSSKKGSNKKDAMKVEKGIPIAFRLFYPVLCAFALLLLLQSAILYV